MPPTVIDGVNVQAVARDRTERIIQLQAWAVWWAEHPAENHGDQCSRDRMLAELRAP